MIFDQLYRILIFLIEFFGTFYKMCITNDTDINHESLKKRLIVQFRRNIRRMKWKMIEGSKKISIHKSQIWIFSRFIYRYIIQKNGYFVYKLLTNFFILNIYICQNKFSYQYKIVRSFNIIFLKTLIMTYMQFIYIYKSICNI